jgi:hypothetical protein
MRLSAAKALIVNAYSNKMGFEMSPNMKIHHDLIGAVKFGFKSAEDVAKSMIAEHSEMCSEAFKSQ